MAYRLTATKPVNSGYSISPINTYIRPGEQLRTEQIGLSLTAAYRLARYYNDSGYDVTVDAPGDVVRFPAS